MKCYDWQFLHKLVNHKGKSLKVKEFQGTYRIKDATFNIACAWNLVKAKQIMLRVKKLVASCSVCHRIFGQRRLQPAPHPCLSSPHPGRPLNPSCPCHSLSDTGGASEKHFTSCSLLQKPWSMQWHPGFSHCHEQPWTVKVQIPTLHDTDWIWP